MRGRICTIVAILLLLNGCSFMRNSPLGVQTEIDWVDFVKLNGNTYSGVYEIVVQDPDDVTDEIAGEVSFKVADHVNNPNYKTRNGDAGFLEIGTLLYKVRDFEHDEILAVKDDQYIGGYKLYILEDQIKKYSKNFNELDHASVTHIELYRDHEIKPFNSLKGEDMKTFLYYLNSGEDSVDYIPQNQTSDPTYYKMVLYTNGDFAYMYNIIDDGIEVYFHPWETRIVSSEIREYLKTTQ